MILILTEKSLQRFSNESAGSFQRNRQESKKLKTKETKQKSISMDLFCYPWLIYFKKTATQVLLLTLS